MTDTVYRGTNINDDLPWCFNHFVNIGLWDNGCQPASQEAMLNAYFNFRHHGKYRSPPLEVRPLGLIGQVGDRWERLKFEILGEESFSVADIEREISFQEAFDGLRLGGGGIEVGYSHLGCLEFMVGVAARVGCSSASRPFLITGSISHPQSSPFWSI